MENELDYMWECTNCKTIGHTKDGLLKCTSCGADVTKIVVGHDLEDYLNCK